MNRKGFTLVELLAVIVLLGIISVAAFVSVTSVINNSKKKMNEVNKKEIVKATNRCLIECSKEDCDSVEELKEKGYLDDLKNPYTGESIKDDEYIIIEDGDTFKVLYYDKNNENDPEVIKEFKESLANLFVEKYVILLNKTTEDMKNGDDLRCDDLQKFSFGHGGLFPKCSISYKYNSDDIEVRIWRAREGYYLQATATDNGQYGDIDLRESYPSSNPKECDLNKLPIQVKEYAELPSDDGNHASIYACKKKTLIGYIH